MIAQLFRDNADFEKFRERVIGLKGEFPFGRDDMIEIGNAYFERYPDCFSNRNCQEVTLGYKLVRVCITEKLIDHDDPAVAGICRAMFFNIGEIPGRCADFIAKAGYERAERKHGEMETRLAAIQAVIDSLPIGMIKERFVGGIANIYNIIYLIKNNLEKLRPKG